MSGLPFSLHPNPQLQASMAQALELVRRGELQRAHTTLMDGMQGAPRPVSPSASKASPERFTDRPLRRAARFARHDVDDVQTLRPEPRSAQTEPPQTPEGSSAKGRFDPAVFQMAGTEQRFHLYHPASGAPAAGRPLILMLHGCTQDAPDFARGTRMNAAAEGAGALALYPTQSRTANHNGCWNWFRPEDQRAGAGEPALLLSLVRQVMESHDVDKRRIYVAGLSAGGAMAAVLAREYPQVFAATGVHSGLAAGAAQNMMGALSAMNSGAKGYEPSAQGADPAVPLIVFHGDRDATVHPRNGEQLLGAAASRGRTETESGRSHDGQRYTRTIVRSAGAARVQAEHWLLHGAGHAWSGGDARGSHTSSAGVNASQEMLRFFLEHPLPDAGTSFQ